MSRAAPDNAIAAAGASFMMRMLDPDDNTAPQVGARGQLFKRDHFQARYMGWAACPINFDKR